MKRIGKVALLVIMSPFILVGLTVGYGLWLLLIAPEQRRREMERYRFDD